MIGWSQRTATMASFLLNFNDVKCLRNSSTTIEVLNNNVVVYDLIFVKLMDQQNREICISDLWLQYVWRDDWDHIARVRRRSRVGGTELAGNAVISQVNWPVLASCNTVVAIVVRNICMWQHILPVRCSLVCFQKTCPICQTGTSTHHRYRRQWRN